MIRRIGRVYRLIVGVPFDPNLIGGEVTLQNTADLRQHVVGVGAQRVCSRMEEHVGWNLDANDIAILPGRYPRDLNFAEIRGQAVVRANDGSPSILRRSEERLHLFIFLFRHLLRLGELISGVSELPTNQREFVLQDLRLLLGLGQLRMEILVRGIQSRRPAFKFSDLSLGLLLRKHLLLTPGCILIATEASNC